MNTDIEPYSIMQPMLAAMTETIAWPDWLSTIIFILVCTFFLLLNAFFVASEFAIVKVRPSQIDTVLEKNPKKAAWAKRVVDNLDTYLSANQLGITLASIGLGIFAEPYIEQLLNATVVIGLKEWFGITTFEGGINSGWSHFVTLAFFTVFHVVIGELIPKAIAIRKPLQVTLALAPSLHIFYWVFSPLILLLNGMANFCLKHVFGIDPVKESEHAHSAEELALLVTESGEKEEVTDKEREILINALRLNDIDVKDVMTPKSEIITLDINLSFEANLKIATKSKHTRFILIDGHIDKALGFVHVKDILSLVGEEKTDFLEIRYELLTVPDTMPLDSLLKLFQSRHERLAMVADEFGEVAGTVFMDNIIEELVGDIQDEFDDDKSHGFIKLSDSEFIVEGKMTINSLVDYIADLEPLQDGEMSTIGGYVTQLLERFPKKNEVLHIEGFNVTILTTEERKVGKMRFRKKAQLVANIAQ